MQRPQELAEQFPDIDIEIKLMDDLWDVVGRSDIVYTATSCVDYVIDQQKMEENGVASGRPMMLVDISVPRNIGEDCKNVSYLFFTSVSRSFRILSLKAFWFFNMNKNRFQMLKFTMSMTSRPSLRRILRCVRKKCSRLNTC